LLAVRRLLNIEISHEVAKLIRVGTPKDSLAHLVQLLADLRQHLQAHFAEEEAGGCLEEAVSLSKLRLRQQSDCGRASALGPDVGATGHANA
jgi:hypothetical protein